MVPSGLLPALLVETNDGRQQVITESQVIMELLDQWHTVEDGYKPMMPSENDEEGQKRYNKLARLERELFSWWCTLIFRPEGPGGMLGKLIGSSEPSGAMGGFLDCGEHQCCAELHLHLS
jgi:glutathione S-transferase